MSEAETVIRHSWRINSVRFRTITFSVVILLTLASSVFVLRRLDHLRGGASLQDVLYIPSPRVLKRMSLGYDGLLADLYWTRAVQYFGRGHYQNAKNYRLLAPLLDITTELDPHLVVAYQFGSVFLSQQPPEGAGEPEKAIALVERGIRENPAQWRLYYNLGWIEFDRKNFAAASRVFERGSKVPGAPPAMQVLAAASAQHAGESQISRFLWTQIYNTTTDELIRATAVNRLQCLQVDEDIARLEDGLKAYYRLYGQFPSSLAELQAIGWTGRVVDPLGDPYVLKPGGRVDVKNPRSFPFTTTRMKAADQEPGKMAKP